MVRRPAKTKSVRLLLLAVSGKENSMKAADKFWKIIKHNWTIQERVDLRAAMEAWMAADKSEKQ